MTVDARPMPTELRKQRAPIRGPHGERDPPLREIISGKLMDLGVGEHLQAVLQSPQVQIRRAQLRDGRLRHEPQLAEHTQSLQERGGLQPPLAPATDELERLHDEFDLAYAARTQLDVASELAPLDLA